MTLELDNIEHRSQVVGFAEDKLHDWIDRVFKASKAACAQAKHAAQDGPKFCVPRVGTHHPKIDDMESLCESNSKLNSSIRLLEDAARLLRQLVQPIKDTVESQIMARVHDFAETACLAESDFHRNERQRLVAFFAPHIRCIVRTFVYWQSKKYHETPSLWKVVEECFIRTYPDRNLDPSRCKISLVTEREWVDFWRSFLRECPEGPLLFNLPIRPNPLPKRSTNVPRYLFRVCNKHLDSADRMTSARSRGIHEDSVGDLLSCNDTSKATSKLYDHLSGPGDARSNLVSWTSSLLFALQYAVYKCYKDRCEPEEVSICVVDTTKFAPHQFVDSMYLIEQYSSDIRQLVGDPQTFFTSLRAPKSEYQNGEYLSQAIVHHSGRSCTVTFQSLIDAGLYNLYPEFDELEGKKRWTNRVRDLRRRWRGPYAGGGSHLDRHELKQAITIAKACFKEYSTDMALALFTLKRREFTQSSNDYIKHDPAIAPVLHRPPEVTDFMWAEWIAKEKLSFPPDIRSRSPEAAVGILGEIFLIT